VRCTDPGNDPNNSSMDWLLFGGNARHLYRQPKVARLLAACQRPTKLSFARVRPGERDFQRQPPKKALPMLTPT
jgi:hypothetical protein